MRKEFNVTGSCNPEWHYMVDTEKRFEDVANLIDKAKYFTINRARQYGKTTILRMILRRLSDRYLVIPLSFEGVADEMFESYATFAKMFASKMADRTERYLQDKALADIWRDSKVSNLDELSTVLTHFTTQSPKPVVLTIDEVDKSSDNQLFLSFFGMLRNKYLQRDEDGMSSTFHSVVLAGVYDVKNLKLKIRPNEEKKYNSPWNIAADFNVDMTFHPEEIAQMLGDYENDVHTGMDIKAISEEIYKYTNGYPFLVSAICKLIDERLDKEWTADGVQQAVKIIAKGENVTLLDDLSKNIENIPELREFLYSIVVNGQEYTYTMIDPMVKLANMFSYIKENQRGKAMIHNLIFEEALFVYFGNKTMREQGTRISPYVLNYAKRQAQHGTRGYPFPRPHARGVPRKHRAFPRKGGPAAVPDVPEAHHQWHGVLLRGAADPRQPPHGLSGDLRQAGVHRGAEDLARRQVRGEGPRPALQLPRHTRYR